MFREIENINTLIDRGQLAYGNLIGVRKYREEYKYNASLYKPVAPATVTLTHPSITLNFNFDIKKRHYWFWSTQPDVGKS